MIAKRNEVIERCYISEDYFTKLYDAMKRQTNDRVKKLENDMIWHIGKCQQFIKYATDEFPKMNACFKRGFERDERLLHHFEVIIARMARQRQLREVFKVLKAAQQIKKRKRYIKQRFYTAFKK